MQLWYCYFFLWTSAALGAGTTVFFEPDPMGKAYLARTSSGLVTLSRESIIWPGGMRQTLVGGRTAGLEASGPDGGASFYYLGSDPKQWRQKVPHYRRVRQAGVYPGIDVEFYGKRSSSAGQCAGINRHMVGDERALQERNSEPFWPRVLR